MATWRITSWRDWSLSRKFLALSGAIVLVTLVAFAALDYVHERRLLTSVHELLAGSGSLGTAAPYTYDHAAFLAQSKQGLNEVFIIHFVHLTVTLLILLIALNLAFDRIILRRLRNLVAATKVMARGTWEYQVDPQGRDELGRLTAAFNMLGEVLARRVADWRNAERLSALAELSNWATRELSAVEAELVAGLEDATNEQQPLNVSLPIEQERLCAQVARLRQIRERLDSEFYRTLHDIRLASANAEPPPGAELRDQNRAEYMQANTGGSHDHD